jgi:RNA polymerase sigma-70 factor (ECF subfamily)
MHASAPAVESVVALVQRARSAPGGDPKAESELCQRFAPAVYAFARRRLRSREAVEEFAQDVFLTFIEALRRGAVDDPARVGGFVLGICRNLSLDRARSRERRAALWDAYGHVLTPEPTPADEGPHPEAMKLEDCLTQLTQRARDVLRFSYVEALSHIEVAKRLEITETNARVLRHRTLQALRECMTKPMVWEPA